MVQSTKDLTKIRRKAMNKINIAVLVSGGGTNLQALIDAEGRGELGNGKIELVCNKKIHRRKRE